MHAGQKPFLSDWPSGPHPGLCLRPEALGLLSLHSRDPGSCQNQALFLHWTSPHMKGVSPSSEPPENSGQGPGGKQARCRGALTLPEALSSHFCCLPEGLQDLVEKCHSLPGCPELPPPSGQARTHHTGPAISDAAGPSQRSLLAPPGHVGSKGLPHFKFLLTSAPPRACLTPRVVGTGEGAAGTGSSCAHPLPGGLPGACPRACSPSVLFCFYRDDTIVTTLSRGGVRRDKVAGSRVWMRTGNAKRLTDD